MLYVIFLTKCEGDASVSGTFLRKTVCFKMAGTADQSGKFLAAVVFCPNESPDQPLLLQIGQKSLASVHDVLPGFLKITGIPRVCNITRVVGVVQQQGELSGGLVSENAAHATHIFLIHADEVVEFQPVFSRQK